ncbi:Fic family protein [Companilactobacillus allii]|uniref:Filamentation induced by cAMP protein fic n=1 Tax=Companilactobacillus allii TaxID=1847728 RepID=A0A1P8Q170_9LACO|nr:Fic family protein [Companilactobacillus allii]APX71623.1 filamentation induced by cAMP protein fic [Companilactobacillus allii]USQ68705.1 Fic family protein [Companilactobacillus allii]
MAEFEDKYRLTDKENIFIAKKNFVALIHSNSKFEGVNTTLPETKTIVEGMSVAGISIDSIGVIVNLKRGWEFVINSNKEIDDEVAKTINGIVARDDSLDPGGIRTGEIQIGGVEYQPSIPTEEELANDIDTHLRNKQKSKTQNIIELMYSMMRNQYFWDGNKRTSILFANYYMIRNGIGILNINEKQMPEFNELLTKYYNTNELGELLQWTYDNCIYGIDR